MNIRTESIDRAIRNRNFGAFSKWAAYSFWFGVSNNE
ncbi:hypothetical protein CLV81_0216 [Flagellimonas meridianipacifica]|uniref:Uncharacterized protein n=1 Tax=Flagellimonas meridianipacifica TaxID=1080225 RepID=A0A2T0MF90_9FLAO|nr:hypothetical protein CLV81_0216 [Allomuricauda pacifica]